MEIIGQVEWRGPHRPSRAARRRQPAPGVEAHHTVTGRAATRSQLIAIARSIYRDHTSRISKSGEPWADVFYGFLVGDNDIVECRGFDRLSGDVPHVTVCLVGRYDTGQDHPTPFQLQAIADIRAEVARRGGGRDLVWHSLRDDTTCPGGHIIAQLEAMRKRPFPSSKDRPLPQPQPTPAPVPTPGEDYTMDRLDLTNAATTPVRGRHVNNLQALLLAAGVGQPRALVGPNGRPDGIAGPGTRAALGTFQQATGTGSNGRPDYIVGPRTWRALIEG